jgi:hypothetical protein
MSGLEDKRYAANAESQSVGQTVGHMTESLCGESESPDI